MTIDVDHISNVVTGNLGISDVEEGVEGLSQGELVQLAAQVAIAEALQEIIYLLREFMGSR